MFGNATGPGLHHSSFNKHARSKGTKHRKIITLQFCPCCLDFLWGDVCWIMNRTAPGPTSLSKLVKILFLECSIASKNTVELLLMFRI